MDRLDYFRDAVAASPDVARARFAYGVELQRVGQHENAITQFRAYLALQEDEGNAWGRLAQSLTEIGARDEAADAYLSGIDHAMKFGHHSMVDEFRQAIEAL